VKRVSSTLTVQIDSLFHREMDCLAIRFPYHKDLIQVVKTLPGATFSRSNKCWFIQNRPGLASEIKAAFQNQAVVDTTLLKGQSNAIKPDLATPALLPDEAHLQALRMIEQKLNLRGYSPNTRKTYLHAFKEFLAFYAPAHPAELTELEIRNYQLHLVEHKRVSASTQNQSINSIKFFYEQVLNQPRKTYYLDRPLKERKLPVVLSESEVVSLLQASPNLKHRTMLTLIYSAGLRRSELLNLRLGDIDTTRLTVFIRGGKGKKDRQSILARSIIPLLDQYRKEYAPGYWLFEGVSGEQYSAGSLQKVFAQALRRTTIEKDVSLHSLRHSFATHLLENGTSTRYIQVLLGHESPITTEIYTHVTKFGISKIKSPLDSLPDSVRLESDNE
jgi:integrase/recombinase XerD